MPMLASSDLLHHPGMVISSYTGRSTSGWRLLSKQETGDSRREDQKSKIKDKNDRLKCIKAVVRRQKSVVRSWNS
jgi:hypothetical protein